MNKAISAAVALLLVLAGCATPKLMSPKEAFNKYHFLGDLNQRLF